MSISRVLRDQHQHDRSHELDCNTCRLHRSGAVQVLTDMPRLCLKSKFHSRFTSLDNNLFFLESKSYYKVSKRTSEFADAESYPYLPHYQCITWSQHLAYTKLSRNVTHLDIMFSGFDYFLVFAENIDHFMKNVSFPHWSLLRPNSNNNCLYLTCFLNTKDIKDKLCLQSV